MSWLYRDLEAEVKNGRFRQDLWFRLNIFPITVPPLRERIDDIPLLVNWFVKKFNKQLGRDISRVNQMDMESMTRYNWPGNVRELANCIERAVINTRGSILKPAGKLDSGILPEPEEMKYKTLVERERKHIIEILEETRWKVEGLGGAARVLGLHPSTLRGRMRKYNIHKPF